MLFEFTQIGLAVGSEKKRPAPEFSSLAANFLPGFTPSRFFKIKQFERPEIFNSNSTTCWGLSQQVAGLKGSPQECLTTGANLSAR